MPIAMLTLSVMFTTNSWMNPEFQSRVEGFFLRFPDTIYDKERAIADAHLWIADNLDPDMNPEIVFGKEI